MHTHATTPQSGSLSARVTQTALTTNESPWGRPRNRIDWMGVEPDRRNGNAATRRAIVKNLQKTWETEQNGIGPAHSIDLSLLLAHWVQHNPYAETYLEEPELIDPDIVTEWADKTIGAAIDETVKRWKCAASIASVSPRAPRPRPDTGLIIIHGGDWLDHEWGAGRLQTLIENIAEKRSNTPLRLLVLYDETTTAIRPNAQ